MPAKAAKKRTRTNERSSRHSRGMIPAGQCGFLVSGVERCEKPRMPGKWAEGASWLCEEHRDALVGVRAFFDKESPLVAAYRARMNEDELNFYDRHQAKGKQMPSCCRPGCANERVPGETYCPTCQGEGWTEDE